MRLKYLLLSSMTWKAWNESELGNKHESSGEKQIEQYKLGCKRQVALRIWMFLGPKSLKTHKIIYQSKSDVKEFSISRTFLFFFCRWIIYLWVLWCRLQSKFQSNPPTWMKASQSSIEKCKHLCSQNLAQSFWLGFKNFHSRFNFCPCQELKRSTVETGWMIIDKP